MTSKENCRIEFPWWDKLIKVIRKWIETDHCDDVIFLLSLFSKVINGERESKREEREEEKGNKFLLLMGLLGILNDPSDFLSIESMKYLASVGI